MSPDFFAEGARRICYLSQRCRPAGETDPATDAENALFKGIAASFSIFELLDEPLSSIVGSTRCVK